MVTLRVCGAARTVTGMCLFLETPRGRVLVDCGMFQGPKTLKALNHEPFPFEPRSLSAVLLTHAHIDHSGLLPRLTKAGYRGPIHATRATADLCSCMLPDAGHIQESEVEILNRRNRRRGRAEVAPIYTAEDAERCLEQFRPLAYGEWIEPLPGLSARWWNAGHMLGSASIEIAIETEAGPMRLLVSGDIGQPGANMQPDPEGPSGGLDHLILESTYGDEERPRADEAGRRAALAALLREAAQAEAALLIPTFAVERAQEVILDLVRLMEAGEAPRAPIHLDSPLAIRASRVFARHAAAMEEGARLRAALAAPQVVHVTDAEESRRLARAGGFRIILAGSGMCEAGRIRQHLLANLWKPGTIVALVGYQATGTLGRLLQEGARRVRILGETVKVAARIATIEGYSAHADAAALTRWAAARGPVAGGVFLVHGEPEASTALAARLAAAGVAPAARIARPVLDEGFRLAPGAAPAPGPRLPRARRLHPEEVGLPDWHNQRAALLLRIEEALDTAPDDETRAALLERLRRAVEGG
ncbi:MAG: MBL fold metallo-hydrolase RNA specificity domain-containing protein [Roseococcus sp.]